MKKIIFYFLLIGTLLLPEISLAQTGFPSKEEQQNQEQTENIEEVQPGAPEGAGIVLGEEDLNLTKVKYIPGDWQYSWQRFWENTILTFTFNQEKKVTYLAILAEKRLAEIEALLKKQEWDLAKATLKAYNQELKAAKLDFENLSSEQTEKINLDLSQDLIRYIGALSILSENSDYHKLKKELKSATNQTLNFQEEIGL